ncbi:carboxylesterase family protein [Pelagibacterium nitratireducens]|uniref:Carboxylic ester hydrolase n=1 Tax=Pelagibacterium nitratireducens TaxID=1046114 RepID=A0ABZ2I4R7_9HYPH
MSILRSLTIAMIAPCLALASHAVVAQDGPTVGLASGTVQGVGGDVVSFLGIPYATPPIDQLRWRAPEPAERWDGVLEATAFRPACMQQGDRVMSEDCLYLNVWAPEEALEEGSNLPVIVWVFGGSFHGGSGDIDGAPLASKGAIVVSMNYRVSTMGFMAHPGLSAESLSGVSGNYGLMDVTESLRWVKNNIHAFGGDPDRVTVWGLSSGASLLTALMASPLATNLFDQAILQSPGALRNWPGLDDAEAVGLGLGEDIDTLRALAATDIEHIRNVGGGTDFRDLAGTRVIGPALDGFVLPFSERQAFMEGRANMVPILIGSVTDEGGLFTRNYPIQTASEYADYLELPTIFGDDGAEALELYPVASDDDIGRAVADSFGDNQFVYGVRGVARAVAEAGLPVYRYMFTRQIDGADPTHGSDLAYSMGSQALEAAPYDASDLALSEAIMQAWVDFAATGNPNGGAISDWPAYDLENEPVYVLDSKFSTVNAPRSEQLDFMERRASVAQ